MPKKDMNTVKTTEVLLFFHGATAPSGPRPSHCRGFTVTLRHTTHGRTPLDELSARCRNLYLTTQNTHKRQTSHAPGEIRTRNPTKRVTANPLLRRRGQWDRQANVMYTVSGPTNCTINNKQSPAIYALLHVSNSTRSSSPQRYIQWHTLQQLMSKMCAYGVKHNSDN